MTAIIQVVSALILDVDSRMLMTYRSATTKRPLMWEHPGGKVNDNETDSAALIRELHEELGVSAIVGKLVSSTRLDVEVTLELRLYAVTIIGAPHPSCDAVDSVDYVSLWDAIQYRPCAPSTYGYCRDIERFIAAKAAA